MSSVRRVDHVVIGGGPVGASAAWFLAEREAEREEGLTTVLVHDPRDRGAHEDWSRLARLSFDGAEDEMRLSRHALSLVDLVDELRSYNSGAPVVPIRPGMLFVASPGTAMAKALSQSAGYGDPDFVQRDVSELADLYPGNTFDLPADTLCWTHPAGLCVSPIELADTARWTAESYGAEVLEGRARVDVSPSDAALVRVTVDSGAAAGTVLETKRCFLFAGARSKEILAASLQRDAAANSGIAVPEFDDTYITGISTVRYRHENHPAEPAPGSGHVPQPITLGQLHVPDLCPFQANFSVVAEEGGDVYKTRLSGDIGTETIDTVAGLHHPDMAKRDDEMRELYQRVFGGLFPHLQTGSALDFNRCVTYRNHNPVFSGTSLVAKALPASAASASSDNDAMLVTTVGCFGVGVKFGPALGQAACAYAHGEELEEGMNVFAAGSVGAAPGDGERVERAW